MINNNYVPVVHTLENLHLVDSRLDEENSYYFLQEALTHSSSFYMYEYPTLDYSTIETLCINFSCFSAKVKHKESNKLLSSLVPLVTFRYLMLSDGSWSNYDTISRKPGYVVEGMYWSNGLIYRVRDDVKNISQQFKTHQVVLLIDESTKILRNFP